MLTLERVVKHYRAAGEEICAVDGVSLHVGAGEIVAVRGPSGSGKTTLLLLIAALLSADHGTIRFDGRDLATLSEDQVSDYLLRDVGFIYQTYRLMPRVSALENAALKLLVGGTSPREAKAQALPWLERLGLGDRVEHPPEELSGGERQRVAIARALAANPRLILADEPTGNLDTQSSYEVMALFDQLNAAGRTIVVITHEDDIAAHAKRAIRLVDGLIVEDTRLAAADGLPPRLVRQSAEV